jgi:glycerol-3-phosphate O-acyltransferase
MARVARVVPVLAVPLCARALVEAQGGVAAADLVQRVNGLVAALGPVGAPLPRRAASVLVDEALEVFLRRGVVEREGDTVAVVPGQEDLVRYYANSIAHHFAGAETVAAVAKQ